MVGCLAVGSCPHKSFILRGLKMSLAAPTKEECSLIAHRTLDHNQTELLVWNCNEKTMQFVACIFLSPNPIGGKKGHFLFFTRGQQDFVLFRPESHKRNIIGWIKITNSCSRLIWEPGQDGAVLIGQRGVHCCPHGHSYNLQWDTWLWDSETKFCL